MMSSKVSSGLRTIDQIAGGFSHGDLVVICGDSIGFDFLIQMVEFISASRKTNLIIEGYYQDGDEETGIDHYLRFNPTIGVADFGRARWASFDNTVHNPRPMLVFSEYTRSASKALSIPSKNGNWPEVIVDSVALEIRGKYGMSITKRLTQLKQWAVDTGGVAICYSSCTPTIDTQGDEYLLPCNFSSEMQTIADVILLLHQKTSFPHIEPGDKNIELLQLCPMKKIFQHSSLLYTPGDWPAIS